MQNPLYPKTGALPDRAGIDMADAKLGLYGLEGFQAGRCIRSRSDR